MTLTAMIKGVSKTDKFTQLALVVDGVNGDVNFTLPLGVAIPSGGYIDFYKMGDQDIRIGDDKRISHDIYNVGRVRDLDFTFYARDMKLLTELRKAEEEAGYYRPIGAGSSYPNPFN